MWWAAGGIHSAVILRSRALARRLEGWPQALVAYPSRLAQEGEHLRMTAVMVLNSVGTSPAMTEKISGSVVLDKST
jgi:hypothetical protein